MMFLQTISSPWPSTAAEAQCSNYQKPTATRQQPSMQAAQMSLQTKTPEIINVGSTKGLLLLLKLQLLLHIQLLLLYSSMW
jgi:hypothetical protein